VIRRAYGDELTVPLAALRTFLFIDTCGKPFNRATITVTLDRVKFSKAFKASVTGTICS